MVQKMDEKMFNKRKPLVAWNQAVQLNESSASVHPDLSGMNEGSSDQSTRSSRYQDTTDAYQTLNAQDSGNPSDSSPSLNRGSLYIENKNARKKHYLKRKYNKSHDEDKKHFCKSPNQPMTLTCNNVANKLNCIEENIEYLRQPTHSITKCYSKKEELQLMEPPENFRSLSIFPRNSDIISNAFLRPNIVKGKYSDTDHYLDVQYRLLKEDFVKPLRDALMEYQSLKKREKAVKTYKDAKVYENVHIVDREFVNGKMCHLLQFSSQKFCKIQWENNNCFLVGSLLCLSSDDFKTVQFATVAHRNPEELEFGLLLIHFVEIKDQELNISPESNFVIMEAPTLFEAYRHNLKVLQELNEDTLPLKEYIINIKTDVEHPHYLEKCTTYDMRPLLLPMEYPHIKCEIAESGEVFFDYKFPEDCDIGKSVEVLNDGSWPCASDLNLDPSQYLALKAALTREFAILQGPPGTGKTYIGLRIVQLLLHNIDQWFTKDTNSLPILVVAQTNHALDQFLQGVMSFSHKIVRIGGQGKNEDIYPFQLNNLKKFHKMELPEDLRRELNNLNQHTEDLKREYQKLSSVLLQCAEDILTEDNLMNYILDRHYVSLESKIYTPEFEDHGSLISSWLSIEPRIEEVPLSDNNEHYQGGYMQRTKYIKNWLDKSKELDEAEVLKISNVWDLDMPQRWNLYKYWLKKAHEKCLNLPAELQTLTCKLRETRTEEDLYVLNRAHVVGMTTTGAAKYRHLLKRMNPQILLVEEAAQILESHVITCLAPNTQHIILIGDHQQLQPLPTVHKLAVQYDMNISLFERMIKNKMDCFTLTMQHRMRPDIADLIRPHIYKDLKNHPTVTQYENIKGVSKNVYFVTHDYNEGHETDSYTKSNWHEATFIIKLCNYFIQQGYDASQITVLTTYNGQLLLMKKIAKAYPAIKTVRFTVVDSYQGEENDIILISFVRSNDDGKIGFLNVANRVCVALSRARKGLYCIGNFELLAERSNLWKNIIQTLKQKEAIGPSLQLSCQDHLVV